MKRLQEIRSSSQCNDPIPAVNQAYFDCSRGRFLESPLVCSRGRFSESPVVCSTGLPACSGRLRHSFLGAVGVLYRYQYDIDETPVKGMAHDGFGIPYESYVAAVSSAKPVCGYSRNSAQPV